MADTQDYSAARLPDGTNDCLMRLACLVGGDLWGWRVKWPRIYVRAGVFFEFVDFPTENIEKPLGKPAINIDDYCDGNCRLQTRLRERMTRIYRREAIAIQAAQLGEWELAYAIMEFDAEYTPHEVLAAGAALANRNTAGAKEAISL